MNLEPCPFCGGEAHINDGGVECTECAALGPDCMAADPVGPWNTRALPRDEAVREAAIREAADIAAEWKSSLKPGSELRQAGHDEAALWISRAILALLEKPKL